MKTRFSNFFFLFLIQISLTQNQDFDDEDEYTSQFRNWKDTFQTSFKTKEEEVYRYRVFKTNYRKIREHNQDQTSPFKMGVNQFTDLTYEEFSEIYLSKFPSQDLGKNHKEKDNKNEFILHKHHTPNHKSKFLQTKMNKFSKNVDLREKGGITAVRNQGQCGSCAAFATIASMEAILFYVSGLSQELSEQFLIDCAYNHYWGAYGAFGCEGAWPQAYLDYVITRNGGLVYLQEYYPYKAYKDQCQFIPFDKLAQGRIISWSNTYQATIDYLIQKIDEGFVPVVTLYAGVEFGYYRSGVLTTNGAAWDDPTAIYKANHAVAIVGYGHDQATGLDYFLIKNSWGHQWGEWGFAKVDATYNGGPGEATKGFLCLHQVSFSDRGSL